MKLPAADLDLILNDTRELWDEFRGGRIFLTGGTGFFGKWLVESFCWINRRLDLNCSLLVLSRDPRAFIAKMPHLADAPGLEFHAGDIRDFLFPEGSFSHVIHAATPSGGLSASGHEIQLGQTIVAGARRVFECAREAGARKLLFTSSGAVYGTQPPELTHVPEDYRGAPDTMDLRSTYGHSKRMAEHVGALYHAMYGIEVKIARCFAFAGPHLPLDANFAIGNFLRDALRGGPIRVQGDGTPYRSYLYAADLTTWLWTILAHGTSNYPYNVGSEEAVTIAELAERVAAAFSPAVEVHVAQQPKPGAAAARYVPSCKRARTELGLDVRVGLDEAIRRMIAWHRGHAPASAFAPSAR